MSDSESPKVYELSEVREHNDGKSCWMVIHDKVYDITKFLDEHPGGEEVLLELAGDDATEPFEDVGHSEDARDLLQDYYVGEVSPNDKKKAKEVPPKKETSGEEGSGGMRNIFLMMTIIVSVGLAIGLSMFIKK